jgi:flagellar motility protein MotE (MotC chaperone)
MLRISHFFGFLVLVAVVTLSLKLRENSSWQALPFALIFSKAEAQSDAPESQQGEAAAPAGEKKPENTETKKAPAANESGASTAQSGNVQAVQPSDLSAMERELLQGLAVRRDELAQWEKTIEMRENVLNATEVKISEKMQALKSLEEKVQILLAEYNKKEDQKIKSLIKVYENMKPKDAARIFETLELPVLMLVVDKMKEAKLAPILSSVDPERAKQITVELAHRRQLKPDNVNEKKEK